MSSSPATSQIQFPDALRPLFAPKRFKVMYGGRGAGRSWGVARALLLLGTTKALRILCVRELQNSIAESVHKLLDDQISALGLDSFYEVQANKIIGQPIRQEDGTFERTTFSFEGIKNNTRKIKSYEGVDICWVEEANNVTKASWEFLTPTIRKKGSEIWITFNPELETDYTYKRFVKEANPELAVVIRMTWKDNPWFRETEMYQEMLDTKERDYEEYLNVWEGHCRQSLTGAVFAKELLRATADGRICKVPWYRETPVDTYWDLGRGDGTAIWFAQRVGMQYRLLRYFEDSGEDIHYYLQELQKFNYTYGTFFLPHDARAKRMGSKRTIEEIVRQSGKTVRIVPKQTIADGINAARIIFSNCWFDEVLCEEGLNRLRHYRYRVVEGQFSNEPVHDASSHGADAFRYFGLSAQGPKTPSKVREKLAEAQQSSLASLGRSVVEKVSSFANATGWMN